MLLAVACGGGGPADDGRTDAVTTSTTGATSTTSTTSTEAPSTTTSTTATTAVTTTTVASCTVGLSARQLAALTLWPAAYADGWDLTRSLVADHGVGGVLLMQMDGFDADGLRREIDALDDASALGLLVATDEEGGPVQRLRSLGSLPSENELSSTSGVAAVERQIAEHGRLLAAVGVDVVLGPVVDVLPLDGSPPLQASRFFAGDAADVAAYGRAYVDGWASAGLVPTLKHFPGHGSASGDTHDVAGVTPPLSVLWSRDLVPYESLVGPGVAVMIGHLIVPDLTDGLPASRSAAAVDLLRGPLGHGDGLVVADALDMAAVGLDVPDAAVASLAAGVDVLLFTDPSRTGEVIDRIVAAVASGELDDQRLREAATRVLRLLPSTPCRGEP